MPRWHRQNFTQLNEILGMPGDKVMIPWQVNHTTVHHACRNICVQVQITIFKSTCANVPARHTHLGKTRMANYKWIDNLSCNDTLCLWIQSSGLIRNVLTPLPVPNVLAPKPSRSPHLANLLILLHIRILCVLPIFSKLT